MSPLGGTLKGGGLAQLDLLSTIVPADTDYQEVHYVSVSQRNVFRSSQTPVSAWCEPFSSVQPASSGHAWRHPPVGMSCFYPMEGWRTPSGGFSTSPRGAFTDLPKMRVPCGRCIGCRLDQGRDWTVRIMHEAQVRQPSCFITLTYDDIHLPRPATLVHSHFQKFIKRVRRGISVPISYFMCGEYGSLNARPHYHAVVFGYDFGERVWRPNPGNFPRIGRTQKGCYSSTELSRYWTQGFNSVGPVNAQSAKYVAQYCLKKVTGVLADEHYKRVDPETGEVYWLVPEYARMSLRPAVGKAWFDRYGRDVLAYDGVFLDGKRQSPPRYYDKLREQRNAAELAGRKLKRRIKAFAHAVDNTPERLQVREQVTQSRLNTYKRGKL